MIKAGQIALLFIKNGIARPDPVGRLIHDFVNFGHSCLSLDFCGTNY